MKTAGILIIIIAMSIAGNSMAERLKRRLHSLDAIIGLIEALEVKIRDFNTPVREFFGECRIKGAAALLCKTAYSEGLYNAVKIHAEELSLENADIDILCEFAGEIGTFSAYEEEKRCRHYREKLTRVRDELAEKLPVRTGLLRSAGLMCGILIAVAVI